MFNSSLVPVGDQFSSFEFEGHTVRVVPDDYGNPWFVAPDVCRALGYANPSKSVADHVDDEDKGYIDRVHAPVRPPITSGYTPGVTLVINQSGVYALIFGSQKPEAKRFKRWVTSEVLPALHKTGQYAVKPLSPAEQLLAAAQQLVDHERRLARLESQIQSEPEHFTVLGYCKLRGLPVPSRNEAQSMGQRAANLSRRMSQRTGKTTDPRYGPINTYHISILDEIFQRR